MNKKLLTSGTVSQRANGRWCGSVWYQDELGKRQRKTVSGVSKAETQKKITNYIDEFYNQGSSSAESMETLRESMQTWLKVFKFPTVERSTYDRYENTAKNQLYPTLGDMQLRNVTAVDIKNLLNDLTQQGYAYSTTKKAYQVLHDFFQHIMQEGILQNNPMECIDMIKKANYMAMQHKEYVATCDSITIFTKEEIEKLKAEAFQTVGKDKHQKHLQAAAYILMLNTGLRTGEMLGVINSDIDLKNKMMTIQRGVKAVQSRDGTEKTNGTELIVGKPKSLTSNRTIPLNSVAVDMIKKLRKERYKGQYAPLVCTEDGGFMHPEFFRYRFYTLLDAAGIERKGLHALRHTFATNLVNGILLPDGTRKSLSPREVADLLGHSTSEITETSYVRRDTTRLNGITDGFDL